MKDEFRCRNAELTDQKLLADFQQLKSRQKKLAVGYMQGLLNVAFAQEEQSDVPDQKLLADFQILPDEMKKVAAAYIQGLSFAVSASGKEVQEI